MITALKRKPHLVYYMPLKKDLTFNISLRFLALSIYYIKSGAQAYTRGSQVRWRSRTTSVAVTRAVREVVPRPRPPHEQYEKSYRVRDRHTSSTRNRTASAAVTRAVREVVLTLF